MHGWTRSLIPDDVQAPSPLSASTQPHQVEQHDSLSILPRVSPIPLAFSSASPQSYSPSLPLAPARRVHRHSLNDRDYARWHARLNRAQRAHARVTQHQQSIITPAPVSAPMLAHPEIDALFHYHIAAHAYHTQLHPVGPDLQLQQLRQAQQQSINSYRARLQPAADREVKNLKRKRVVEDGDTQASSSSSSVDESLATITHTPGPTSTSTSTSIDSSTSTGSPSPSRATSPLPTVSASSCSPCTICLCEFSAGEVAVSMPCSHNYHTACLETWLAQQNSCPVCRYELETNDEEYNERLRKKRKTSRVDIGVESRGAPVSDAPSPVSEVSQQQSHEHSLQQQNTASTNAVQTDSQLHHVSSPSHVAPLSVDHSSPAMTSVVEYAAASVPALSPALSSSHSLPSIVPAQVNFHIPDRLPTASVSAPSTRSSSPHSVHVPYAQRDEWPDSHSHSHNTLRLQPQQAIYQPHAHTHMQNNQPINHNMMQQPTTHQFVIHQYHSSPPSVSSILQHHIQLHQQLYASFIGNSSCAPPIITISTTTTTS